MSAIRSANATSWYHNLKILRTTLQDVIYNIAFLYSIIFFDYHVRYLTKYFIRSTSIIYAFQVNFDYVVVPNIVVAFITLSEEKQETNKKPFLRRE